MAGGERQDFVSIRSTDPRLASLGHAALVCAEAGDLCIWDSRTIHASDIGSALAPMPLDDATGLPRLARAACYVCMVPAEPHLAVDPMLGICAHRLPPR